MSALAIALAALPRPRRQRPPSPEAPAPADAGRPAAEAPHPKGAPTDPYQFVGWCYGALRGYLDLHDEVMPEVTRIESTYRPPGRKLADDLKVYADMQKEGKSQLKLFQSALTAAEKASLRPINVEGAAAVQRGRSVWQAGPEVTKARKAQEWMSWTLPAKCETTATRLLEARATLLGSLLPLGASLEVPPARPPPRPRPRHRARRAEPWRDAELTGSPRRGRTSLS